MTRRAFTILLLVVAIGGMAAAVIASSVKESKPPVHTVPGGTVHTGAMPPSGTTQP